MFPLLAIRILYYHSFRLFFISVGRGFVFLRVGSFSGFPALCENANSLGLSSCGSVSVVLDMFAGRCVCMFLACISVCLPTSFIVFPCVSPWQCSYALFRVPVCMSLWLAIPGGLPYLRNVSKCIITKLI